MLLELDLCLGREAHAHELDTHAVAELGLGQQEEVVGGPCNTRSGAITRAFAVSSNASQLSPGASASTSFESIRCR